ARSAACAGGRRSSTVKPIVMLGASGNGGFTCTFQWSSSTAVWLRTDGIAGATTSGSMRSANTRSGGAAKRRSPSTTVMKGGRLAGQRDLREPERLVEVDPAQLCKPHRRELAGHDRDERAQPFRDAGPKGTAALPPPPPPLVF